MEEVQEELTFELSFLKPIAISWANRGGWGRGRGSLY